MHYALSMKNCILAILTLFALTSCGGRKGELRITGTFKGLNNTDLIIFSQDGVIPTIDTLHIREEKIDWSCPYNKEGGTITIVYPTYSTLTLFVNSGDVIKINGDAKQLNATKVSGNPENEAYTHLRQQFKSASPQEIDSIKKAFYASFPESPVTQHLQLQDIEKQKPSSLEQGENLPPFSIVTRGGDTITTDSLRGKYTLIAFWANWKGGTNTMNIRIRKLRRQTKEKLTCISYNMDVNSVNLSHIEQADTITWHSYGDQKAFQSELVARLGIREVPYYILTDTTCNIIATGSDWDKDIKQSIEKFLLPKK